MRFHPASEIFPLMGLAEFEGLKADIEANGQIEPIVTYKGQIIDGRNRFKACEELGIKPKYWEWPRDSDPVDYVVSLNLHRRHLSESQRTMVAVEIANMKKGDNQHASIEATSQTKAAKQVGVSRSSVQRGTQVKEKGISALSEAVKQGAISVNEAATIAEKPKSEQKEIVKLPTTSEARKKARETGKSILARNGKYYDGRTNAEERRDSAKVDQNYHLITAYQEVNKLINHGVTPERFFNELEDYMFNAINREFTTAEPWLCKFSKLWRKQNEKSKVA